MEARPFLEAVDANEVADYYEVIKVPLGCLRCASCWDTVCVQQT